MDGTSQHRRVLMSILALISMGMQTTNAASHVLQEEQPLVHVAGRGLLAAPKPPSPPQPPSPPKPRPPPVCFEKCAGDYQNIGAICYRPNTTYLLCPVCSRLRPCSLTCEAGFTRQGCNCFRLEARFANKPCAPPPAPPRPPLKPRPPHPPPAPRPRPPMCLKCPDGYSDGNAFCYKNNVVYRKACPACAGDVASPVGGTAACSEPCKTGYTEQLGCTCYASEERVNKIPC